MTHGSNIGTGKKGDVACKINDLAQNFIEWTTETSLFPNGGQYGNGPCILRGDIYGGEGFCMRDRNGLTAGEKCPGCSFRAILYL